MNQTLLASALAAGIGLAASTLPSAALPVITPGVTASAGAGLVQVRMTRRHRMRRRQGSASRGNAGMPSRGAGAQQYGGTTSGPRR